MIETLVTLMVLGLLGSLLGAGKEKEVKQGYSSLNLNDRETREKITRSLNEWEDVRQNAFSHYGRFCSNCNHRGTLENPLNIHHILSPILGGTNDISNLKVLCRNCHQLVTEHKLSDKFVVPHDYGMHVVVDDKVQALKRAIDTNTLVSIHYVNGENIESSRVIQPKKLYIKNNKKYIVGYCYMRNEDRTFLVSRIKEIRK